MTVRRRSGVLQRQRAHRRGRALCSVLLLVSLAATPAAAGGDDEQAKPPATVPAASPPATAPQAPPATGSRTPAPAPAASGPAIGLFGFGHWGYTAFAASESFEAVLGSSSGPVWGGGVMVAFAGGRFFAQVSAERFSADGERVFVSEGEVFPLGIPLTVEVTPLEFTAGYRFVPRPRQKRPLPPPPPPREIFKPANPAPGSGTAARPAPPPPPPPPPARASAAPSRSWVPYAGGGVGLLSYSESSSFGDASEEVDESFTSYHVLGGVDFRITRWFGAGVEAAYRWVPDALGESGVSAEFGEEDLGGATIRVRVIVGR